MKCGLAVLVSGRGSNLMSIAAAVAAGKLEADIKLVLSNNPSAPALDFCRDKGIPVWVKDHKSAPSREAFDSEMQKAIVGAGAQFVVLAGYMRLLSPGFITAFSHRIVNIHPSLLPSFTGAHAGRDALAYGPKVSGCTVHFVDEKLDNGPVIIQAVVPVGAEDTEAELMPRIHALEHRIYPQALQWLAQNRLRVQGRKVLLVQAEKQEEQASAVGVNNHGSWLVHPPLEGF